ncbi:fatty acid synthase-like [Photinus pyralis]|uniref:fatty acid synthase-like n=1 Tax=Photinus pyralis TaxID=7054 RepID=UPI001266F4D3|nr:fatty acid synthase-like [Photinus pyralis]XP_031346517.1 fatty acid synthase-like [Photinus pyralis]
MVMEKNEGVALAHPLQGEEVVITGMAGRFPESDDIYQYRSNIYNKVDMITSDNRRWLPTNPEIPHRIGKINHLDKLDAGHFDLHYHEANQMDPMVKIALEKAYEAIIDAGYNKNEMDGANCGVFIGCCFSESEEAVHMATNISPNFSLTGASQSMTAQRMSHYLNLRGPSHTVDTACSSSLYALEHAYRAIRTGRCDSALVGGLSLCLNPMTSLQFARLGVLSADGMCKPFDEDAKGYARSETVSVVFLQKAKDARRIYAQLLHTKTNSDGYKEQGITFPSSEMQKVLLDETYEECRLDPAVIDFVEAHATGTRVGDPEETAAMEQVFCTNRVRPLIVGSIKSYLGHPEGASGMCSLVKVLIGMEDDCILPNIHYDKPRQSIKALVDGRMVVPLDRTPLPKNGSGVVAINCFGFGGSNAHVILKKFEQRKVNGGLPEDDLPRLMCVSGRVPESLNAIFDDIGGRKLDAEYCRLLQEAFKCTKFEHPYRGYIIHSKAGELKRSSTRFNSKSRVCLLFPRPTLELLDIGSGLFKFSTFSATVQRIASLLPPQVDVIKIIKNCECKDGRELVLASLAIQLAVAELLKKLNLSLDYTAGMSIGELSANYANEKINLEQAIAVGYEISRLVSDDLRLDYALSTKSSVLLSRLQKVIPNPEGIIHSLLNPKPLEARVLERKHYPRLALVVLGSQQIRLNGFTSLNISGSDAVTSFLDVVGSIYMLGHNLNVETLYPPVKWPVSCRTPMISPLIKWNYNIDWLADFHSVFKKVLHAGSQVIALVNKEIDWSILPGHVIDGMTIMPAIGYLFMIWETYCKIMNVPMNVSRVRFNNVRFHKAVHMTKLSEMSFKVTIGRGTNRFEIGDIDEVIVSGSIRTLSDTDEFIDLALSPEDDRGISFATKDIYKELRLRGYNYSGAFRAQETAHITGLISWIKWDRNWIAFIDNMLQTKLLGEDTRSLYVPTFIGQLKIDAMKHFEYVKQLDNPSLLPVYNHREADAISCGGVELRNLYATPIQRRKVTAEPVLETHKFVPFNTELPMQSAVRVLVQIFLENTLSLKVKIVEVAQTDAISPILQEALNDQPLVKTEVTILGDESLSVPNMKVHNKALSTEKQCAIVILEGASGNLELLQEAEGVLKENGIIISREGDYLSPNFPGLALLAQIKTETETLVLLRKVVSYPKEHVIMAKFDGTTYDWLSKLQSAMRNETKTLVVVENEPLSGVLGFVNCLRREPGGMNLKCVFVQDEDVKFNLSDPLFSEQLSKDLAINVLKDGAWGSYRHLPLERLREVERQHVFCNQNVVGNMSTLSWVEGLLSHDNAKEPERTVKVYASSINFMNVMLASGRVPSEAYTKDRLALATAQGVEYAGIDAKGERVMGIVRLGAMASSVVPDGIMTWRIPDEWTLTQSASVAITYSTVLCSFFVSAHLKPGQSLLIHSGAGGVGQAAIHIALFCKCQIFTTVGTEEKRKFIMETFPEIPASHIGNSRDTSFVQMVLKHTKGRGVDLVLNSLAEEKLKATLQCLAPKGYFVEIGKYDLVNSNKFALSVLRKGSSYAGCMLDMYFRDAHNQKHKLKQILDQFLKQGAVKPLNITTFNMDHVEEAYRYMAAGKHIGKVVVKVRDENQQSLDLFKALPRFSCDPSMTYIILGGLGGFGLELVDWLILRGARKLVLVSRNGVRNGYAASRIRVWKMYEATIRVSTEDVTIEEGCARLLESSEKLAPVAGIFNLAVVLQDDLFENQKEENFVNTLSPKARATQHLDILSRQLCPRLQHFVVFSSVSCGRGNTGQTTYGMANSIMERICEKRKREGYPGLAIQWGAIGEVGLVAEMQEQHKEIVISGTLQQRVASCLSTLEIFLLQNEPIVASMVVAEKKNVAEGAESVITVIKGIMGITDLKTISEHASLAEIGMDSMAAVEIKQILERDCEVFLSPKELRTLTFAKLKARLSKEASDPVASSLPPRNNIFIAHFRTEEESKIPLKQLESLAKKEDDAPLAIFLPGIEGVAETMESLANKLKAHVECLQYTNAAGDFRLESFAKSLSKLIPHVENHFNLVAYSYGCVVALELASILEVRGLIGKVVLIDGAPEMLKKLIKVQYPSEHEPEASLETAVLFNLITSYVPMEATIGHRETVRQLQTLEERVEYLLEAIPEGIPHSKEYQRRVAIAICEKTKSVYNYEAKFPKLKSEVTLINPNESPFVNYDEDYGLQKLCEKPVQVHTVEGTHMTIVENPELADYINKIINN